MTERDIFLALLDLPDPTERSAFLTKACAGDTALRERVESLLHSHDNAGSFLGTPALPLLARSEGNRDTPEGVAPDNGATQELSAQGVSDDRAAGGAGDLSFLAASTRPDALGRLGHYEVLEVLGRGGFGIVFRAFDETLQCVVAIKVLAPELAVNSPARKRFLREARSSAKVRHENVVQVYAVEEEPLPYLVMEFVPGQTLQERLDRTGPLEVAEVVRLGRQIAEGLAAAHATGLIHRDVKPGNILIEAGPHPHVKITDFGLARAADDASLTQSGMIAGTPMYMAPEQASADTLDHRADLFSLGSVLYTMCTGRPPFRAPSTLAVLKRVAEDTPRPIREIIPEVPPWLCDLIARLHAKKPEERFASAQEVADLLERGPAQAKDEGGRMKDEKTRKQASDSSFILHPSSFRGRRWAAAAAVLLVLLGGLSFTEATGVTDVRGTVIRLFSPEGTLVVEVDDPGVSIKIDGVELVITGAGPKEIRLKPGRYTVEARKDGKLVSQERVIITKNGRQVVQVSQEEALPDARSAKPAAQTVPAPHITWLKAIGLLPLDQQGDPLAAKLKEQLPGFEDAFRKALPAMPSDRQTLLVDVWLKERKPVFVGPEDVWVKAMPDLAADAQAVLLAAWLKQMNPGFDGTLTHKAEGKVITSLEVPARVVQDLTPLRVLTGLKTLVCRENAGWDNQAARDADVLKSLTALETINGKPVAQFWKDAEARQAEFQEWLKLVPTLTARQQVAAVAAKFKERNPGFQGVAGKTIKDGVVTRFYFMGEDVTDLFPVRALSGLKYLQSTKGGGPLSDLAPLKGMALERLELTDRPNLRDLTPLKGMPLTRLNLTRCSQVEDLAPLKDMPLTYLNLYGTRVRDLEPLRGMPLTNLHLRLCFRVEDIAPLKDMPLTQLSLSGTHQVKDFSLLKGMALTRLEIDAAHFQDLELVKGMPLKVLHIAGSRVTDLTPLQGMPLEEIRLNQKKIIRGLEILRDMKSLKTIGTIVIGSGSSQTWPAAEFWERYDKGEFK